MRSRAARPPLAYAPVTPARPTAARRREARAPETGSHQLGHRMNSVNRVNPLRSVTT